MRAEHEKHRKHSMLVELSTVHTCMQQRCCCRLAAPKSAAPNQDTRGRMMLMSAQTPVHTCRERASDRCVQYVWEHMQTGGYRCGRIHRVCGFAYRRYQKSRVCIYQIMSMHLWGVGCLFEYVYVCLYCVYECVYAYVDACVCMCVCVCVCVRVCNRASKTDTEDICDTGKFE
jgi:hypothetical protein